MLLNEMSRSMLNALYTNGCVRTIRGVHRAIFLNDVIGWLCGVGIDMYVIFEREAREFPVISLFFVSIMPLKSQEYLTRTQTPTGTLP